MMRNAYLISSMLSCCEVWYNLTEWELRKLERADEKLLRNILNCSSQVSSEILSLELGLLPVRFIIKLRRILYLEHILKQRNKNSLLYNFFIAQMQDPKTNDWVSTVKKDLEDLDINLEFSDIEELGTNKFTKLCKMQVKLKAFEYLQNEKLNHEKVLHIKYEKLEMAKYLTANDFEYSVESRQYLFQCRVSDIQARANRPWQHEETHCISCKDINIEETGKHILDCKVLIDQNDQISYIPQYSDLYSTEIQEQMYVSTIIKENMRIRKDYLKERIPV
jgi:hypothetical protein